MILFFYRGDRMGQELIIFIICTAITTILGIVAYFLKRTMDRGDKNEEAISDLKDNLSELSDKFATKEELREIKENMKKITSDIEYIKERTVKNEDFIRVMTRLESKIDEIKDRGAKYGC